jgi:ribonuclease P/MRP protein subunit POP5
VIKREKRRYLALKTVSEHSLDEQTVLSAVQSSVCKLFGEYGASKANIKLIKTIPEKQQVVIRCSHLMLEQVRAAIASIVEWDGKPVAIHVVGVSGTLKALANKT